MKIIGLVLFFLMVATASLAAEQGERCTSSDLLSSSVVVYAAPAVLCGIRAISDGTNNCTCTAKNNATSNAGTVVGEWITIGANYAGGDNAPMSGVRATAGLYGVVAGTGCNCIFYYRPGP